ncbi:MAG: ferric reductase-like transmembrane domain-containing protein [Acidimicrobiia bacterium]
MDQHFYWYTSRATGIVAYVLLAAAMAWGVAHSIRLLRQPRPPWMLDMHRFLGGIAVVFVLIHVFVLLGDNYANYSVLDLLVPFSAQSAIAKKDAVPMTLGIVAMYLLVAVEISSLLMRRLPRRFWKAIHYMSYGLYALATVHLLLIGSDADNIVLQWTVLICCAINVFLVIVRIAAPKRDPKPDREPDRVATSA